VKWKVIGSPVYGDGALFGIEAEGRTYHCRISRGELDKLAQRFGFQNATDRAIYEGLCDEIDRAAAAQIERDPDLLEVAVRAEDILSN
jgi:hypothetical protein